MSLLAFVAGRVVPLEEACVPLCDDGLLRGDGCFEVVRVYDGIALALEEHLERMSRSASVLGLPLDGVREAFAGLCPGFDGYVRVLITRGPPPRVFGLQEEARSTPTAMRLLSVSAPWLAPLGSTPLAGAKTLSYAHHMAARRLAETAGYHDAILVAADGTVLEGPTWSVLWVEGEVLHTPPLHLGILDSITRRILMQAAPVQETVAPLARLRQADEVIVASTARESVGVSCLDDREWDGVPGPVARHLGRALHDHRRRG